MKFLALSCLLVLFTVTATAEQIPEYALLKDYENCMGGQTAATDHQRARYCSCIRNEMRKWDDATYAGILMEQAKSQQATGPIQEMAQMCIQKVVH